jgi:hypothetical protein
MCYKPHVQLGLEHCQGGPLHQPENPSSTEFTPRGHGTARPRSQEDKVWPSL